IIEEAARFGGQAWIVACFAMASVLTAAAVVRVTGRIFAGWGPSQASAAMDLEIRERPETEGARVDTPIVMIASSAILLVMALASGCYRPLGEKLTGVAGRLLLTE